MSFTNWDDVSVLSPEIIAHEVSGTPQNFRPISVARLGKVRKLFTLLAKALSTILKDDSEEQGTHTVSEANGDTEFIRMPKKEALAMHHDRMRSQAIDQVFEGLMEAKNLNDLACVCMESMPETFPDFEDKDAAAFVKNVPLPIFGQMLVGVVKANKGVFGSFGNKAVAAAESRLEKMTTPLTEENETEETVETHAAGTSSENSPDDPPKPEERPRAARGPVALPNPETSGMS